MGDSSKEAVCNLSRSSAGALIVVSVPTVSANAILHVKDELKIAEIRITYSKLNVLPQSPSNKIIGPIYLKRIIPIILETAIDSRSVKVGDIVFSKLKEDLYYGRQLIAPAGSLASGLPQ